MPSLLKCQTSLSGPDLWLRGICTIRSASSLLKARRISSIFHPLVIRCRRVLTVASGSRTLGPEAGQKNSPPGIHPSPQILMLVPSPMCHLRPKISTSLPARILFQVYKEFFLSPASMKDLEGKCFAFKTLEYKESSFIINLHPCFASMTRLKTERSLKPKPPSSLLMVRRSPSHPVQPLTLSAMIPKKNLLSKISVSLQT